MTDTEKAALCARIDELCAEVERLRKAKDTMRGDAMEIGVMLAKARDENAKLREENERLTETLRGAERETDRLTHEAAELSIENAKLRELVRGMWDFYCVMPDEPHASKEEIDFSVEVWRRMRELGIEATA